MKHHLERYAIYNSATQSYLINRKPPTFEHEDANILAPMLFLHPHLAHVHMRHVESSLNLPDGQLFVTVLKIEAS